MKWMRYSLKNTFNNSTTKFFTTYLFFFGISCYRNSFDNHFGNFFEEFVRMFPLDFLRQFIWECPVLRFCQQNNQKFLRQFFSLFWEFYRQEIRLETILRLGQAIHLKFFHQFFRELLLLLPRDSSWGFFLWQFIRFFLC